MKSILKKGLLFSFILICICGCNNAKASNTITVKDFAGTWHFGDSNYLTFKEDGTYIRENGNEGTFELIGNWIILDNENPLYYEFINGKLFVTDNGAILEKK